MISAAELLHSMENTARSAPVQLLRSMICTTLLLLPGLADEDRAYAEVLLLKLDHLAREQVWH
jgi:hypothetical protein